MFEQSILIERPTKAGWGVLLTITVQLLCLSIAILLPLIFTERLLPFQWANTLIAAPPLPPPVALPMKQLPAPTTRPTSNTKVFQWPIKIPTQIANIVEAPAMPASSFIGVVGGTGAFTAAAGLLGDLLKAPAVPPPAPVVKPKTVEAQPLKPIAVSSGVQAARLIRRIVPLYPQLAKQARISGTVRLIGIIGKDGTIQNLQLVSGPPLLVQSAFEAVRQWIYHPTLLNGQPVEVIAPIDVVFTLTQ